VKLLKSENHKLSTLAVVALTNLCAKDRVMKEKIIKYRINEVIER